MSQAQLFQNPSFTKKDLEVLQKNVEGNSANKNDYEKLERFVDVLGIENPIPKKMERLGFINYDDYLNERKKQINNNVAIITGTILGVITALKIINE